MFVQGGVSPQGYYDFFLKSAKTESFNIRFTHF